MKDLWDQTSGGPSGQAIRRILASKESDVKQPPRSHHGKEQELPPGASADRHEAWALAEAVSRASVGVKVLPAGQLPAERGCDARGPHSCGLEGSWLGLSRGLVSCAGEARNDPPIRRVMLNPSTRMVISELTPDARSSPKRGAVRRRSSALLNRCKAHSTIEMVN